MAVYFNAAKLMINSLMATVYFKQMRSLSSDLHGSFHGKTIIAPHNLCCGFDGIELTIE